MKRKLNIQKTVVPLEYNGQNFNAWVRHIQRPIDKIYGTDVAVKIK